MRKYLNEEGTSPFATWFAVLDTIATAKTTVVLARIEEGNLSKVMGLSESAESDRI